MHGHMNVKFLFYSVILLAGSIQWHLPGLLHCRTDITSIFTTIRLSPDTIKSSIKVPSPKDQTHLSSGFLQKKKAKWSRYSPGVAQRVGRGIALLFHDRGTRRGERSAARLGHTLPPEKARYPFYRRFGEPQSRSGLAEYLFPTGIRSRTIQPVVSRYTDRATRPTHPASYPGLFITRTMSNLIPLTWRIWWAPNNASKWKKGI